MASLTGIQPAPQRRYLAQMCGRQCRNTNRVDIAFNGHFIDFIRALEKGSDRNLKPQITKGRGNDLLSAIMSVLAQLGDKQAWRPPGRGGGGRPPGTPN